MRIFFFSLLDLLLVFGNTTSSLPFTHKHFIKCNKMLIRAISIVKETRAHSSFNIYRIHRTTITLRAIYFSSSHFFFAVFILVAAFHSWYLYWIIVFSFFLHHLLHLFVLLLLLLFFSISRSLFTHIIHSFYTLSAFAIFISRPVHYIPVQTFWRVSVFRARTRAKTTTLCPIDFYSYSSSLQNNKNKAAQANRHHH